MVKKKKSYPKKEEKKVDGNYMEWNDRSPMEIIKTKKVVNQRLILVKKEVKPINRPHKT